MVKKSNDLKSHDLTSWFVTWGQKRVKYTWVPKSMINDWVNKGHTNLNMFSVVDKQIRSLSSKQSKLNFWNLLHPQFAFLGHLLTQTATWQPNYTILTSSVIAILKAMTDRVFLGPSLGQNFVIYDGRFSKRERECSGADWLDPFVYYI